MLHFRKVELCKTALVLWTGDMIDSAMLAAESGLYNQLLQSAVLPNDNSLCIYGNPAYPLYTNIFY